MDDMQQKLGAILGNPQMMKSIMSMAQSMGQKENPEAVPVQQIAAFASQAGIDSREQTLLSALSPYLHRDKLQKLEKAMRAAKMAQAASSMLERSGQSGR